MRNSAIFQALFTIDAEATPSKFLPIYSLGRYMDGHRLINQVTLGLDNIKSGDDDLRLISAHGRLAQALQSRDSSSSIQGT